MARRRAIAMPGTSRFAAAFPTRLVVGIVSVLVVIVLALAGVGAGLTYYVTSANNSEEAVNPQSYLLSSYISLSFTDRMGGEHDGWLLLGLRGAPVIIMCHGYESNR